MPAALFAFLHHIAAFTLAGAVVAEFVLVRDDINLKTARKLLTADLISDYRRRPCSPQVYCGCYFSKRVQHITSTTWLSSPKWHCS